LKVVLLPLHITPHDSYQFPSLPIPPHRYLSQHVTVHRILTFPAVIAVKEIQVTSRSQRYVATCKPKRVMRLLSHNNAT